MATMHVIRKVTWEEKGINCTLNSNLTRYVFNIVRAHRIVSDNSSEPPLNKRLIFAPQGQK